MPHDLTHARYFAADFTSQARDNLQAAITDWCVSHGDDRLHNAKWGLLMFSRWKRAMAREEQARLAMMRAARGFVPTRMGGE
jgi:hypothetical protein